MTRNSSSRLIVAGVVLIVAVIATKLQFGKAQYNNEDGGYGGGGYGGGGGGDSRPKLALGLRVRIPAMKFELPRMNLPKITISAKIKQPNRPRVINLPEINLDTSSKIAQNGGGGGGNYADYQQQQYSSGHDDSYKASGSSYPQSDYSQQQQDYGPTKTQTLSISSEEEQDNYGNSNNNYGGNNNNYRNNNNYVNNQNQYNNQYQQQQQSHYRSPAQFINRYRSNENYRNNNNMRYSSTNIEPTINLNGGFNNRLPYFNNNNNNLHFQQLPAALVGLQNNQNFYNQQPSRQLNYFVPISSRMTPTVVPLLKSSHNNVDKYSPKQVTSDSGLLTTTTESEENIEVPSDEGSNNNQKGEDQEQEN